MQSKIVEDIESKLSFKLYLMLLFVDDYIIERNLGHWITTKGNFIAQGKSVKVESFEGKSNKCQ